MDFANKRNFKIFFAVVIGGAVCTSLVDYLLGFNMAHAKLALSMHDFAQKMFGAVLMAVIVNFNEYRRKHKNPENYGQTPQSAAAELNLFAIFSIAAFLSLIWVGVDATAWFDQVINFKTSHAPLIIFTHDFGQKLIGAALLASLSLNAKAGPKNKSEIAG